MSSHRQGDRAMVQAKQDTGTSRISGLTEAEAAARRARGQNNIAPAESSRSYRRILLQNAVTPINLRCSQSVSAWPC